MEGAKYTIKEAVQAIQELDFGEDTYNLIQYNQKRMQNSDISEIINMKRQDILLAVLSHASKFSAHICFCRKMLFHVEKTFDQRQKF